VILAESHAIPKFHGQLSFRSGNAAVVDRGPGLAEMTATVVRTGTKVRVSRQIEEDLRRIGADLSSSAGADTTGIGFAGLSELAEPLLGLVDELAREAAFPEPEFERERRQKLEEVKLDRTQPSFLASEQLRKVLFGTHPYATVAPTESQVVAYKRSDLTQVYQEFYTPENALLVMVGDFDTAVMMKSIEKTFSAWTGKRPAIRTTPEPAHPKGRRVYLVHVPGAVQTQILAGCHAITRKHADWVKIGLTNSLYGGAFNSRLVMNIREDKGYTYSPRSGAHPLRHRSLRHAFELNTAFAPQLLKDYRIGGARKRTDDLAHPPRLQQRREPDMTDAGIVGDNREILGTLLDQPGNQRIRLADAAEAADQDDGAVLNAGHRVGHALHDLVDH